MPSETFEVLLYYWFTELENPPQEAEAQRILCEGLGLRGRILVSPEGINGTVSGHYRSTARYRTLMESDPRYAGIEFKTDPANGHVFRKLKVKFREETVTLGTGATKQVFERTVPHLTPSEWKEALDKPNTVVLDARNAYESDLGRFKGAQCPPIQNFRDLPDWILENRSLLEGKTILTYCTGGIRCEKLGVWMIENGFESVYQLHGGIVAYGKNPETLGEGFEGVNVVFDDRVATSAGPLAQIVTKCRVCDTLTSNYVNCANVECNMRMVLCESCEMETLRCCSQECATAPRRRAKGKKWHETPQAEWSI